MVRFFPCALDFGQSNNTFYGTFAFIKYKFCLAPRWKINWPRQIYLFYISPLKFLNLGLISVQNWMATGALGKGVSEKNSTLNLNVMPNLQFMQLSVQREKNPDILQTVILN